MDVNAEVWWWQADKGSEHGTIFRDFRNTQSWQCVHFCVAQKVTNHIKFNSVHTWQIKISIRSGSSVGNLCSHRYMVTHPNLFGTKKTWLKRIFTQFPGNIDQDSHSVWQGSSEPRTSRHIKPHQKIFARNSKILWSHSGWIATSYGHAEREICYLINELRQEKKSVRCTLGVRCNGTRYNQCGVPYQEWLSYDVTLWSSFVSLFSEWISSKNSSSCMVFLAFM